MILLLISRYSGDSVNRRNGIQTLLVVAAAVSLSGCGSSVSKPAAGDGATSVSAPPTPKAAVLSAQQLSERLLTDSDLPDGWSVIPLDQTGPAAGPADPPTAQTAQTAQTAPTPVTCDSMPTTIEYVVQAAGTAAVRASTIVNGRVGTSSAAGEIDDHGLPAAENLFSLNSEDARHAMQRIRDLVAQCPQRLNPDTGDSGGVSFAGPPTAGSLPDIGALTDAVSVAPGPALGDESLVVHDDISFGKTPGHLAGIAVVVRVGSTLVVLDSAMTTPHNAAILAELAPAAVKALAKGDKP